MLNQKIFQFKYFNHRYQGSKSQGSRSQGFTLIELMVTISILAILASVAIPAYHHYVQGSRRTDAIKALGIASVLLENCKNNNAARNYANCLNIVDGKVDGLGNEYYDVTVKVEDISAAFPDLAYTLTAKSKTGTSQAGDDECTTYTMTQTGKLGAYDSTSTASDVKKCWKQ